MRYKALATAAAFILLAAACGDSSSDTNAPTSTVAPVATESEQAPTTPAAAPEASLAVSASALGDIVTDGDGKSLYLFLADTQGEPSTCYDQCEENWPPVTAALGAGDGIDASLLGTADRTDGTVQVTYNGWPLYYFANDDSPGDTNGQGVGDVWYLIDAQGIPLQPGASGDEAAGPNLTVAGSALGDIVADDAGNSLYVFFADTQGEASTCYDSCEANWPPLTKALGAGDGIDASLLGAADRTDGSVQVTYNGWPLYYFAGDGTAGDTNGQGVGDVWYLIDATGTPIT
jgi:predicted lipoprotein with Yx(FWY)xxD motif